MRIMDWSSDGCSSDRRDRQAPPQAKNWRQAPLDDEARRGAADLCRIGARLGDARLQPLRLRDGLLMATQSTRELTLDLRVECFPYHQPFRISGHVFTETALLVAEISDGTDRKSTRLNSSH